MNSPIVSEPEQLKSSIKYSSPKTKLLPLQPPKRVHLSCPARRRRRSRTSRLKSATEIQAQTPPEDLAQTPPWRKYPLQYQVPNYQSRIWEQPLTHQDGYSRMEYFQTSSPWEKVSAACRVKSPKNITLHLHVDTHQDLEAELEFFCRLVRLGNFRMAQEYLKTELLDQDTNFYVGALILQMLYDQQNYFGLQQHLRALYWDPNLPDILAQHGIAIREALNLRLPEGELYDLKHIEPWIQNLLDTELRCSSIGVCW